VQRQTEKARRKTRAGKDLRELGVPGFKLDRGSPAERALSTDGGKERRAEERRKGSGGRAGRHFRAQERRDVSGRGTRTSEKARGPKGRIRYASSHQAHREIVEPGNTEFPVMLVQIVADSCAA